MTQHSASGELEPSTPQFRVSSTLPVSHCAPDAHSGLRPDVCMGSYSVAQSDDCVSTYSSIILFFVYAKIYAVVI